MLGLFRSGLTAFAGLVLSAATASNEGSSKQPRPSASFEQSLRDIADSLKQANQPDTLTQPCRGNKEDRASDLCAQWNAADAANAAATWTERTFYLGLAGSVIGILTLAAATAAAKFAKDAAEHTEESAIEAKEANKFAVRQLRPYLHFEKGEFDTKEDGTWVNGTATVHLRNGGQTPATITRQASVMFFQNGGASAGGASDIPQTVGNGLPYSINLGLGAHVPNPPTRQIVLVGIRYEYESEYGCWIEDIWLYGKGERPEGKGILKQGTPPDDAAVVQLETMFPRRKRS